MSYTRTTVGRAPLNEICTAVADIYSSQDSARSIWDVWSHVIHHAAGIVEEVRKNTTDRSKLLQEIADFALWLFTACHKLDGPVGKARASESPRDSAIHVSGPISYLLWNRYPGICCWCGLGVGGEVGSPKRCQCQELEVGLRVKSKNQERARAIRTREVAAANIGSVPRGIDDWQEMFGDIYRDTLARLDLRDVSLHLLEEIGEVSDGLVRMYTYTPKTFVTGEPRWRQIRLEDEVADTCSWLFALVQRLSGSKLSEIIWDRYGSDAKTAFYCRHCKEERCTCEILLIPSSAHSVSDLVDRYDSWTPEEPTLD